MQFKPSAGIFVGGLATSFGGALLLMMSTAGDSEAAAGMALVGVLLSIGGIIMLCIGAARALAIIDAVPAAFRNLDRVQAPHQQAPAPQPANQQFPPYTPQQYGQQPPVQ